MSNEVVITAKRRRRLFLTESDEDDATPSEAQMSAKKPKTKN
jgi:hypothetical protein